MIRKLKRRFIRIAVIALSVAMVLVTGIVNLVNWLSVRAELQGTAEFLAESSQADMKAGLGLRLKGKSKHTRNLISQSSWFGAYVSPGGEVQLYDLEEAVDPDEEAAAVLVGQAVSAGRDSGFLPDYLYIVQYQKSGGRTVTLLNVETSMAAVRSLALISAAACLGGIALACLIMTLASRKAIAPTLRNMEQQKRFITDASHELKTPLTVISTNMELLQMESPGNQWVASTQKQAAMMRRLVDELVYLSRMEEEGAPLRMETLSLGALLRETAEPFEAMAEFSGRELTVRADDTVKITGDRASVQRLISVLCDNAMKYAAGDGAVIAEAKAEGRYALLTVSNEVAEPLTREQCDQLFHRFYRADASRSKDKRSGFGIGLAIASAIIEKHGAAISARMADDGRLVFTCRFARAADR